MSNNNEEKKIKVEAEEPKKNQEENKDSKAKADDTSKEDASKNYPYSFLTFSFSKGFLLFHTHHYNMSK